MISMVAKFCDEIYNQYGSRHASINSTGRGNTVVRFCPHLPFPVQLKSHYQFLTTCERTTAGGGQTPVVTMTFSSAHPLPNRGVNLPKDGICI